MRRCHSCGGEWVSEKKQPAVKESCEHCGAYLHCCLNCKFHDPGLHNQCAIPTTDWVGDRAGCNFCHDFTFGETGPGGNAGDGKAKAREAFDNLFDGSGDAAEGDQGPDAFDRLFGQERNEEQR